MASRNLLELSEEEQRAFLDSFDTVFCDVDGVLWTLGFSSINGAAEAIKALRNWGKKVYFVTNNDTVPLDLYMMRMKKFEAAKDEVIRPAIAIAWYLEKINFDKEIYVVGFQCFKDELKRAGFNVVYDAVAPIEETKEAIVEKLTDLRPNVKAVIIDYVVNLDYMGLSKCVQYINKNNALFIAGAWDPIIPFGGSTLIGSSYFAKAVQDATGVAPKILSKPGKEFNEILQDKVGPYDPKRVLFIGDSPVTDMTFATNFGYQKLMPLTGETTEQTLKNWQHEERFKPDYVVNSITDLLTIVTNLGLNKVKL